MAFFDQSLISSTPSHQVSHADFPEYLLAENQTASKLNVGLFQACEAGDIQGLKEAIRAGANPNWRNQQCEGQTGLHRAIYKGHLELVKVLLAPHEGRFPTLMDMPDLVHHNTPLHVAAMEGDIEGVRLLISHQVPLDTSNHLGNTALHFACSGNHYEMAFELIKTGATVNLCNHHGATPLTFAISGLPENHDSTQLVALLCDHGVDVNKQDNNGTTALHVAATRGFCQVVDRLISSGANVAVKDTLGHDATYYARFKGHTDVEYSLNAVIREDDTSEIKKMVQLIHESD